MLDRTNITFLSKKFLGHVCVYFIGSNDYDCNRRSKTSSYGYDGRINRCSQLNICRNRQQQHRFKGRSGRKLTSNNVVVDRWVSDNNEGAKSGINTTVCGPDTTHACQTSSGEK